MDKKIAKKGFIEAYEKSFGNILVSCKTVGIARQTYYNWIKKLVYSKIDKYSNEDLNDKYKLQGLLNNNKVDKKSKSSFEKNKLILVATCGLNNAVLKHYMKKNQHIKIQGEVVEQRSNTSYSVSLPSSYKKLECGYYHEHVDVTIF